MCGSSLPLPGRIATDVLTGGAGEAIGAITPQAPGAPNLPPYPQLTPEEQTNLGQQSGVSSQFGSVIGGASQQLGQNQSILQMISGLFNPDGTINQNAVTQLRQQTSQSNQTAGAAGQQTLSSLGGTQGALGATQAAYTNALSGNAPANQQLQFTTQRNFQAMKEQAAQQGIAINGDDWNSATSSSTAGQRLIQDFQQNYNIQNQNYQLGYLGQLGGNMAQLAGVGASQANTGLTLGSYAQQNPLGYVQNSITNGMSALSPLLSSYQEQLTSAYNPLYAQQVGPYQQQMAQQQANYQAGLNQYNGQMNMLGGIMGLGGTLGAAYLKSPMAAAAA